MSGTSADGVDAALVSFKGSSRYPKWQLLNAISIQYPHDLRKAILNAGQGVKLNSSEWLDLTEAITEFYFQTSRHCDPEGQASIIGCHGQTVFHRPPQNSSRGASLQLIQAPLLAMLLDRTIIYDFRSKDLALGGHGAPLAPLLDEALFGRIDGWRAVLNLGGIANISLIPPRRGPDKNQDVLGWDCGPANSLIDLSVEKISNGEFTFDRDGLIAAKGSPDLVSIKRWLGEAFFSKAPPKSTGRELFGLADLNRRLSELQPISSEDFISTMTTFTSCLVANDLNKIYENYLIRPVELLIAGGGCKNPVLLKEIINRCHGIRVSSTEDFGLPVNSREALSMALLAWWNILNRPSCFTTITGASRSSVLGIRANPN